MKWRVDCQDLEKVETRAFKQARAFYEGLADRLVASGHALDVFACSLDQVGLDEMRPAVASTGVRLPDSTCRQPSPSSHGMLRR